jgi:hypothetical protein
MTLSKTYTVYPPNCAGNHRSDKFRCEVRTEGFIADWDLFDTEREANQWGLNHSGARSPKAGRAIFNLAARWGNK